MALNTDGSRCAECRRNKRVAKENSDKAVFDEVS